MFKNLILSKMKKAKIKSQKTTIPIENSTTICGSFHVLHTCAKYQQSRGNNKEVTGIKTPITTSTILHYLEKFILLLQKLICIQPRDKKKGI